MDTMTKRVVKGAMLLTIAGLISKVLSAAYRIPLQNLTGDLGFYIYQQVYPIIGTVMILSLYGFPVAISKLTVETIKENKPLTMKHFYFPLLLILFSINSLFFIFIYFASPFIAESIGDQQLQKAFQLAAFLFLFMPFLALLRGVFQGKEEMKQTAYSQVIEQVFRVTIIIAVAYFIFTGKLELYRIGEAGVLATMTGMIVAILFLSFITWKRYKREKVMKHVNIPWRYYFYVCVSIGFIASLNHMILILIQLADVLTLVPNLVEYGLSPIQAMESKGVLDRAQPLIQFGIVFGSSFALALIPAVVQGMEKHQENDLYVSIQEAIAVSFYIAFGATVGLIILLPETNILLFTNTDGTRSIQILVLSILLTSITITACAILQGINQIRQPVIWICIAFLIKLVLNELLVPIWGIGGSAIATVISLSILCSLILTTLYKKLSGLSIFKLVNWKAFFFANGGMMIYLLLVKGLFTVKELSRLQMGVYVLFLVFSGAFIYLLLLLRYKAFTKNQLLALPFSSKITKLEKFVERKSNR